MSISTVSYQMGQQQIKKLLCPVIPICPDINDIKSFSGMGERK